jgi:hypothetical protein
MELEEIIKIIKQDFPQQAIDLSESLELLKKSIGDTMNAIDQKMTEAFARRDFAIQKQYSAFAESIYSYENRINDIIDKFELDEPSIYESLEIDEAYQDDEMDKNKVYANPLLLQGFI